MRAVLRLVRLAIGESTYRFENELFRDAGGPLSEVRDAKILVEALDKLKECCGDEAGADSFAAVRMSLIEHQQQVRKRVLEEQGSLSTAETILREALNRVDDWSDAPNRWRELGVGVKHIYRRGREAFDDAKADRSDERLHEWRKQVKYLRYQLEVLIPLWPDALKELACQAEKLGERLGDDHDLAVLRQMLVDRAIGNGDRESAGALIALIDRRREEIHDEAIAEGDLLYRKRPKQFTNRLRRCWKRWRKRKGGHSAGKKGR